MNEIIKACIMYEFSGRIFHKKHVLIPPIKVKIKSINFLTDLASAKPPRYTLFDVGNSPPRPARKHKAAPPQQAQGVEMEKQGLLAQEGGEA